ncbi:MAG: RdgB/HAM1 family non-canonical purine NTP pyrophosphatase, partial [Muribaculaceae bacterium]|nr:RdgB/HAM1 family non-canonical purine NTP pyrophosphatase [Muribaculaceae bacterium]
MTDRRKLVMATNNAGKLREARAIAGDRLEILSLGDIGYHHDIEETADTLEGNALIKVRAIKEATGLDCFADDTGLIVDALGGAPGVHTARYAGEDCDPDRNIDLMLRNLEGVSDRKARFRTCVALSLGGEEHIFEGTVEGSIATERSGSHGFGYDPIFIPEESGICFAEMSDDAKNAISHRSRAISAMMKWLSTLCVSLIFAFGAKAADSSSWRIYNTFDDVTDNVFDTPDKTYFLVQAQYQDEKLPDNSDKLCFLFCLDKESGEIRPYNSQNFLHGSLISLAAYNAEKNYLLIVYDDKTIEILYDDGSSHTLPDLKNVNLTSSKEVRSISFDPDNNLAYLATDFGYIAVNDKRNEIASSGIYGTPVDWMARIDDKLLLVHDGKLYWDSADSRHISMDDFKELDWFGGSEVDRLIPLSSSKCIVSKRTNGREDHYIMSWAPGTPAPKAVGSGNYIQSTPTVNKQGVLFIQSGQVVQIDRESGQRTVIPKRDEDKGVQCGSWDLRNFYFSKSRDGFYSLVRDADNSWTVTSEPSRPDAPAVFRSDALLYTPQHGMLADTHGQNQNFASHLARNPLLLSGLRDGVWTMYGLPYHDPAQKYRITNPCGIAQDPDDPDVFYFGSALNGLLRYNIKDMSSLLHMTRSDDNPDMEGHVSLRGPYAGWKNAFIVANPHFDTYGNLVVAHTNTDDEDHFSYELWIWPKESRLASVSPETFRPFIAVTLDGIIGNKSVAAYPLSFSGNRDMVVCFTFNKYGSPFVVYDHNGTPQHTSDDRQSLINTKEMEDADGKLSVNYLYCAVEDPATGLVWIGSDNGVFTFDPRDAFSSPGKVSRIKVSRNDGTSLADYLLSGTIVNDISIDALGRKWFSLSGGGLVCTSADGKTIIQEIDTDNSMLPSDMVYASAYNPDNNSLMIATSAGLCEYYLSGQASASGSTEVRAYPNPVRHDYYGWVVIDGLEEDCIVKIADSAGNIVRELGPATAGRVQWDVCGMDLNRVPSGVYFVLASSGPG